MANELKPQIVNPQIQPQQINPQMQLPITAICQPGQDFEVMFTVLPNGIDAGKLRFSVLVAPRLKPACDTTLANFPGFLDWPNLARTLTFQLFVDGVGAPIPAQPLYNPAALDSNLWKAIFNPTTFVRQFKFDPEERTNPNKHYILPLRERNFYRFQIKQDLYQNLAVQSPTKLPEKNMMLDRLGPEGAGIVQKIPSRIPGKFEYQMGPAGLQNPMVNLLNMRDKMIQREFQQFQQPGGQLPGGGIIPGGQINPGMQMTPGAPMTPGTPQMPGMQMGPGALQGGRVFQRGTGPGGVSARKVPRNRDPGSIQAATGMSPKAYEFQEYRAFAYKPGQQFVKTPLPGVNDWKNIIDFHQIVGSLADYPEVMRRLGLILDFVVPDAGLPPKSAVSVRTTGLPPDKQITPKTRYDKPSGFHAEVGSNPDLQDGLLKFGRKDPVYNLPLYDVVPGDVEGAMAKIANLTRTLLNVTRSDNEEESQGLPALRSGGLSVAHAERDIWLDMLLDSQQFLNEELKKAPPPGQPRGSNIFLLAENLIRGFRIDVRSRPVSPGGAPAGPWGAWRSLNERLGFYYVSAGAPIWKDPIRDEGWISLGLAVGEGTPVAGTRGIEGSVYGTEEETAGVQERGTGPMSPMTPQQKLPIQAFVLPVIRPLLVYESLFRWVGWGLSVPRPYRPLPDPGVDARCAPRPDPVNGNIVACSPIPGLNFMAGFLPVPGTLPRLRFGRQYQFRARVVDLAGNSRLLTDPLNPAQELPFVTSDKDGYYDRFEPVPSPAVVLTRPLTGAPVPPQFPQLGPGGKPLGPGFPGFPKGEPLFPGECVNTLIVRVANVEQPAEPKAGPENPIAERHIVPPQISAEMSEAHGMFDAPGKDAYAIMTSHDSTLEQQFPTPPGAGDFYIDSTQRPFFTVPYLPDPMAVGANLVIYAPGTDPDNGYLHQQPFVGAWPDMSSFRLAMKGGIGNPQFNNGILEVPVPIGEERLVRLGSFIKPGDERLFGIWRWITERANPQQIAQLLQKVIQGRHWMITPWQPLRLVHAVQQPVLTPQWVCLQVLPEYSYGQPNLPACADATPIANAARQRRMGQTTATIDATMVIHRPSTMSLDLVAGWREPVDRGVMKSDQEDPERKWLYLDGKSSPFAITISYAPEAVRVATLNPDVIQAAPIMTGPVLKRGLPGEGSAEGEAGAIPDEHRTRILQDAHELPPESEVRSRGLEEGAQAPGEMGVQERGTMGQRAQIAPLQQAQIQKTPPIVAQPKQPTGPQGPPAFDETPFRCAPGAPPPPPAPPQGIPAVQFRFQGLHRFGDTRYRCVNYKVKAMSRYRHLFRPLPVEEDLPQVKQNPPRFMRESPWLKADILSTAPPDPPKVLYVIPTFKWETTPQGKRRTGGGLRVYLDRPWFSSGEGERLAVVLFPDSRAEIPDYALPYVSQWGLDPLWQKGPQTGPPIGGILAPIDPRLTIPQIQPQMPQVQPRAVDPGMLQAGVAQKLPYGKIVAAIAPPPVGGGHPAPEHFLNEDHVRYDLGINEVRLPLETVGTRGTEQQYMALAQVQPMAGISVLATRPMPVTICAFNVYPDPSRQLWYCDIEMNPGAEYFPFVRLALARYQVNSIRGAHLSKVVVADFAQLLPERAISAVPDPKNAGAMLVSVTGVIGYAYIDRKTVLEASVEEANPNVPGELAWSPIPNLTVDASKWQFAGNNQRTASIMLPTAGPGKVFRLIVKEYEEFMDTEADEEGKVTKRAERRLVYADVLPMQGQLGLTK